MGQASVSKSEIDRLGDRLRENVSTDDLRALDAYRLSFTKAYHSVVSALAGLPGVEISGRPAKSTTAIVEKLRRETIRLSQMQDIAGCRIVVPSIVQQDASASDLQRHFPNAEIVNRRHRPSNGYRAVHVIISLEGRVVEVQFRTQLQHLWAELSEKLADLFGIAVKYGGGDGAVRGTLDLLSEAIELIEDIEIAPEIDLGTAKRLSETKEDLRKTILGLLKDVEFDQ